jgi:hypothetical protein
MHQINDYPLLSHVLSPPNDILRGKQQDIIWWRKNMTQERVVIYLVVRMIELLLPWPEPLPSTLIQKRSCILHKSSLPKTELIKVAAYLHKCLLPYSKYAWFTNPHLLCIILKCTKTSTIDKVTGSQSNFQKQSNSNDQRSNTKRYSKT